MGTDDATYRAFSSESPTLPDRGELDGTGRLILFVSLHGWIIAAMPFNDRDNFNLQEAFEYARATIQTLIAINGGAAAAIIAFYGQALAGHVSLAVRQALAASLLDYAAGVVLAALTLFCGYFAQLCWGTNRPSERNTRIAETAAVYFQWGGMIFAVGSLTAFGFGCWSARLALLN